jgi:NitT/TauT family transport system permease protein
MLDDALNRDALEREASGGLPSAGSFTAKQQSDMEAATGSALTVTADDIINYETRTLGRDYLALAVLFFLVVAWHIQNPLATYALQFGRAWRNAGLQTVMGFGLIVLTGVFILAITRSRAPEDQVRGAAKGLRAVAVAILVLYCALTGMAAIFKWNPLAAVVGVDAVWMMEQVDDDTPPDVSARLQTTLVISTAFEYAAIASVIVLWRPWTRFGLYRRAGRRQFAAIVVGAAFLLIWEALILLLGIQEFLLPRPSVIAGTFLETYPRLVSAAWITFQNAFWGFVLGCGLGILTGMIAARFISFSRALLPIAIAINAVPIIALAPIFNNWFGGLNPFSKIAICAVLTYFPAMISTVRGLTTVDPLSLELMRSYAASQIAIFRKVRLPNALPYIFAALKVATTLATIGAIVSEYFGGSTAGLGFKIRDDAGLFKYPDAWASIVMASLFGILFYLVVSAVERALLHWHVSFREK